MRQTKNNTKKKEILISFIIITLISLSIYVTAVPSQPSITYLSNETSSTAGIGRASVGDKGGYITTVDINAVQQNYAWKAYVGNVSGKLILEDQAQFSIYEWNLAQISSGNVYISRNQTVSWGAISCSNRTVIQNEDTFLNLNSSNANSINKTFNGSIHKSFIVSGLTYSNSTCPAISTYINDAPQSSGESNKFQEVLLQDSLSNLVYMTVLEQDHAGFDNNQ